MLIQVAWISIQAGNLLRFFTLGYTLTDRQWSRRCIFNPRIKSQKNGRSDVRNATYIMKELKLKIEASREKVSLNLGF